MPSQPSLTPPICRAARALLGWSQGDLARNSKVAESTVADFERGGRQPVENNLDAMRIALETAGLNILADGVSIRSTPVTPSAIPGGVPIRLIDTTDLEEWAERIDCQSVFPELINKLVVAEVGLSTLVQFASHDATLLPGWDGKCNFEGRSPFVPTGISGWELSRQSSKTLTKKATDDYQKRTKNPLDLNPAVSTFVFATPRVWPGRERWEKQRRKEGNWADVRTVDAVVLVQWIERHPGIGQWLAAHINKHPEGVSLLSGFWQEWSLSTEPPMSHELVLAGRDTEFEKVRRWLEEEKPSVIAVHADSPAEATAFLAACISRLPPARIAYYFSKALIAHTAEASRNLGNSMTRMLIVTDATDPGRLVNLANRGHHVFVACDRSTQVQVGNQLSLDRVAREPFEAALLQMVRTEEKARSLTNDSARSLDILRRIIPSGPGLIGPVWAQPGIARTLIPALLAGGWNEGDARDVGFMEELSGLTYDQLSPALLPYTQAISGPLAKSGTVWKVIAPRDAWFRLGKYVTASDLDKFAAVVQKTLGAHDPRFDMDADNRWMAGVYGVQAACSGVLASGLADSLVALGVHGNEVKFVSDASGRAGTIVRDLLAEDTPSRWYALSTYLRSLAEAAPIKVMDAVEQSLAKADAPVTTLFGVEGSPTGGMGRQASLLWALEVIAWDPQFLSRAASILAQLAAVDPEPNSNHVNRPHNSLREILLSWKPQTLANQEQRLSVIDTLRQQHPEQAWKLMLSLMPRNGDIGHMTAKPRWNDLASMEPEPVTPRMLHAAVGAIFERVLADARHNANRWAAVVAVIGRMQSPEQLKTFSDAMLADCSEFKDTAGGAVLWAALRKVLSHHRSYPNSDWAMKAKDLEPLAKAYEMLTPSDFIAANAWAFSPPIEALPEPSGLGYQEDEVIAAKLREAIIVKVLASADPEGVMAALCRAAKNPNLVGFSLGATLENPPELWKWLDYFTMSSEEALRTAGIGVLYGLAKVLGDKLLGDLVDKIRTGNWTLDAKVQVLTAIPREWNPWTIVASLGPEIEDAYWRNVPWWTLQGNAEKIALAVPLLVKVGRPVAALRAMTSCKEHLPDELIVDTLAKVATSSANESVDNNDYVMLQYSVEEAFGRLDKSEKVDDETVGTLEWAFLRVLEHSRRPPVKLHAKLTADPAFFADVISTIYRPAEDSGVVEETLADADLEQAQMRASMAYRLLSSWHAVPGTSEKGMDAKALRDWVDKARSLCEQKGRLGPADSAIGKMLAWAPPDSDGTWPASAVRDLLEVLPVNAISSGLHAGLMEKRGVTTRAVFEGGRQETAFANRYREWAKAVANKWPKTGSVLTEIARQYDQEARWEDEQAQQREWH